MTEKSIKIGGPFTNNATTDIPESEKGCFYYFRKFDDQIVRPIFIYKYNQVKNMPEISFHTMLQESEAMGFKVADFHF
jgi:hypothetical protein